jgi:flagellar basal-body rod modification protein FlgD
MQIFSPMASTSNPALTGATPASGTSSVANSSASSTDQLTNESTFLKLLVAQVKHQDPLSPADPTQFIGQLVQFSQLEQLLGINQGVQSLVKNTPTTPSAGTSSPSSSTGTH